MRLFTCREGYKDRVTRSDQHRYCKSSLVMVQSEDLTEPCDFSIGRGLRKQQTVPYQRNDETLARVIAVFTHILFVSVLRYVLRLTDFVRYMK